MQKYFIIASIQSFIDDRSILYLLPIASTSMFGLNMRHLMEFRLFEPVAGQIIHIIEMHIIRTCIDNSLYYLRFFVHIIAVHVQISEFDDWKFL